MAQTETSSPLVGSVADVAARLALWARRAPKGLARVEFVSDFSRREAVTALRAALPESLPVHEIEMPFQRPPLEVVHFLRERLRELPPGIVSVTGFAAAFSDDCSLEDALRVLNFHREELAQFPLRQIWWMPPPFLDAFLRFIPDLDSWFLVRLSLSEVIVDSSVKSLPVADKGFVQSPEEAHKQSAAYITRFENAIRTHSIGSLDLAYVAVIVLRNAPLERKKLAKSLLFQITPLLRSKGLVEEDIAVLAPSSVLVSEHDFFSASGKFEMLGELCEYAGRTDEAEAFYKASVEMELNSSYHLPGLDRSCRSMIRFYVKLCRYSEAEAVCKKWIEAQEKTWGQNTVIILPSLDELLAIYLSAEKYKEAEQIFYRMLHSMRVSEPRSSIEKLLRNNMAWFYRRLG